MASEAVAISKALEPVEQEAAKKRQGSRTDKHPGKLPQGSSGRTRDKVAGYVGMSGRTLQKAINVAQKSLTPHFSLDSKERCAILAFRKEVRGIMERKSTMLRFPMKLHERLTRESGERRMKTGKRVGINDVVVDILEGYFSEKDRRAKGKRRK